MRNKLDQPIRFVLETPRGSVVKYEMDGDALLADRVVKEPFVYHYGYIKNTLWHDGDPLDAFLITDQQLEPGCEVNALPVAVVAVLDNGEQDDKLVCVPSWEASALDTGTKIKGHMYPITRFLESYKEGIELFGYREEYGNTIAEAFFMAARSRDGLKKRPKKSSTRLAMEGFLAGACFGLVMVAILARII